MTAVEGHEHRPTPTQFTDFSLELAAGHDGIPHKYVRLTICATWNSEMPIVRRLAGFIDPR
jgi:hypothetical protein